MNILITGAAGSIGSHLFKYLRACGHTVAGIDNYATGRFTDPDISKFDIRSMHLYGTYTHEDLCKPVPDCIIHLAALADIVPSVRDPLTYHDVNVTGTVRVLEYARKYGVKRVIYAASASCYGANPPIPTPETAPCNPRYPYALTKYVGEQYAFHYGKLYGISVTSLRLFNVFGPDFRTNGSYGAVFGVFLSQLAHGEPFTVVGDGEQRRDFTYVTDVCEAFELAAVTAVPGIFNVGSGRSHSVNELVNELDPHAAVVNIPKRAGEPADTCADITKIKRIFFWRPLISFAEGVERMRESVEQFKDAPLWTPERIAGEMKEWHSCLKS